MTPWWTRFRCAMLGHEWIGETRAAPVIPLFWICARCRKWERAA